MIPSFEAFHPSASSYYESGCSVSIAFHRSSRIASCNAWKRGNTSLRTRSSRRGNFIRVSRTFHRTAGKGCELPSAICAPCLRASVSRSSSPIVSRASFRHRSVTCSATRPACPWLRRKMDQASLHQKNESVSGEEKEELPPALHQPGFWLACSQSKSGNPTISPGTKDSELGGARQSVGRRKSSRRSRLP